jgi:methyl-accepting chemotaxis protein
VNVAVEQMNQVTQQVAANAEESAAAAEELNSQSEEMRNLVGQFRLSSAGNTAPRVSVQRASVPVVVGSHSQPKPGARAAIDFSSARTKHLLWKTRLRAFLEGKESLTEAQAVSHRDCDLGKWLYSQGMRDYGHLPEMQQLEKIHAELHAVVKRVVRLKEADNIAEAEREFHKVEPISQKIIALLSVIEQRVKGGAGAEVRGQPRPSSAVDPAELIPLEEEEAVLSAF